MKRLIVSLQLLVLALVSPVDARTLEKTISGEGMTFVVRAGEVANLVYQLNILSSPAQGRTKAILALWEKGLTPEDFRDLQRWRELRDKYEISAGTSAPDSPSIRFPGRNESIDLSGKIRIAAFLADDLEEYYQNLGLVMLPGDAQAAYRIAKSFRPRFSKWWAEAGERRSEGFLDRFVELCSEKKLPAFFARVARFYEADLADGSRFYFNLIARPENEAAGTKAEQLENHSEIEILGGDQAEDQADVIAHEAFHFFYWSSPRVKHQALIHAFSEAKPGWSMVAYNLLNESVATALGNGLVGERILPPEQFKMKQARAGSFYSDDAIDPIAKALMPVLRSYLDEGKTIYDASFVTDYLSAFEAAMGERVASPRLMLRNMQLVYGKDLKAVSRATADLIKTGSVWSFPLEGTEAAARLWRYPDLSAAAFISPSEIPSLAAWKGIVSKKDVDALLRAAGARASFIYGIPRGRKASLFIFVFSGAEEEMKSLNERFISLQAPLVGVMK